ncbi:MAG: DNA replication and repair protein RecF, partial [Deltaproteobacteria bacterium]
MRICHVRLGGFRNFDQLEFQPSGGINLIYGNNGQGKTNLLESLYLLAQLKSFRPARPENLIGHGASAAQIRARVNSAGVEHHLQLLLTTGERRLQVDGKKAQAADFLGLVKILLFAPEETGLVRGAPTGRRAFVDRGIFLIDTGYLQLARQFRRCLLQRNTLLRSGRMSDREYDLWSRRLAESGADIRRKRLQYLEEIRPLLQQCY